ncbi:MAG: PEP/pyruvate-binding domain-containing protein [Bacteroidota bacterium]
MEYQKDKSNKLIDLKDVNFHDTSFNLLMQKRIYRVLLICSNYDAFMLEEDGRIDELIFNEYVSLNLRYPPVFIRASGAHEAIKKLEEQNIDLIISMLNIEDTGVFEFSNLIKKQYPKIPIVVLTPFSKEVSIKIDKGDLSSIDYVFCWLGNSDILLAIIKLIEDKMNTPVDVEQIGVQIVILVEDSIRYYSSYLPNIYKIFFQQSKRSMSEGVNEHQQNLRMRGRPKILLATNYEQAIHLYEKYKRNILGVISDISYNRNGKLDKHAGIHLCKKIISENEHMPFLLQSSDIKNEQLAKELKVGFLNKYSKTLSIELRNYIIKHLAFGDFIFRMPGTLKEINRATDLKSLQEKILKVPDESIEYHIQRNDFSKWLNARALFEIAQLFKYITPDFFKNTDEVRTFIFDIIANYRRNKGRGVIAKFEMGSFDEYLNFSRVGDGSIGGKARGLAFIDSLIKKYEIRNKYENVIVSIPRSMVLSTEIFDEFMEFNNLYKTALSNLPDEEILDAFIAARLPSRVHQALYTFLSILKNPIAVRSSSKLEDSHYQPFAGIYSTYMVPNYPSDTQKTVKILTEAIKSVYASVFFKSSKAYMAATSNVIDEEKMGIILQEVCGKKYGERHYPTMSGVARSINFYPVDPEKNTDGIVHIAFGLGKYIVDGGIALRFSPKYPQKVLQLGSTENSLRETQKYFYAINLAQNSFIPSVDDGKNLLKLSINDAIEDNSLKMVASTFDIDNNLIQDGINHEGKKIITFSPILKYNKYPIPQIIEDLLDICEKEMNNPIEIEFAVDLNPNESNNVIFNFLQIRPIVDNDQSININIESVDPLKTIVFSNSALGNGIFRDICDFIYIKPEVFDSSKTGLIAKDIERLNDYFIKEEKHYILVGPGRWGSSDPWLGIPVKWAQISMASVIVESGLENYRIDPSQGTHFFQNLTSFRVGYLTVNPYINDGFYDLEFLNKQEAVYENEYIRHLKFPEPVIVEIDGKSNKGVIYK